MVDNSDEEWDAYYIAKAILTEVVDPSRIFMRDAKSYCAILLDDNNRKPITRSYFSPKQKSVAVFDNEKRTETKIAINDLNELIKLSEHFKRIAAINISEKLKKLNSYFIKILFLDLIHGIKDSKKKKNENEIIFRDLLRGSLENYRERYCYEVTDDKCRKDSCYHPTVNW